MGIQSAKRLLRGEAPSSTRYLGALSYSLFALPPEVRRGVRNCHQIILDAGSQQGSQKFGKRLPNVQVDSVGGDKTTRLQIQAPRRNLAEPFRLLVTK